MDGMNEALEISPLLKVFGQSDVVSLIVSFLALRDIALGTFAVNRMLHGISRGHIQELLRKLSPLLAAPFGLQEPELLTKTALDLPDKNIGAEHMLAFASAIASDPLRQITELLLGANRIDNSAMQAFSSAFRHGALPNLVEFDLSFNQIADSGCTAFFEACGGGAGAKLERLMLRNNDIGHVGMAAFAKAAQGGALRKLRKLSFGWNSVGEKGLLALSTAISSGTHGLLESLQGLALEGNRVGDTGVGAFADAITANSAPLPNLSGLYLGGNNVSRPVKDVMRAAAKERNFAVYI